MQSGLRKTVIATCLLVAAQEGESELDEVERELQAKGADFPTSNQPDNGDGKAKLRKGEGMASRMVKGLFSPVLIEAFVLTFLAEWGDRSQIATIGALHDPPLNNGLLSICLRGFVPGS